LVRAPVLPKLTDAVESVGNNSLSEAVAGWKLIGTSPPAARMPRTPLTTGQSLR
jgi:hypothetical protein